MKNVAADPIHWTFQKSVFVFVFVSFQASLVSIRNTWLGSPHNHHGLLNLGIDPGSRLSNWIVIVKSSN